MRLSLQPRLSIMRAACVAIVLLATMTRLRLSGDLGAASARLQRALTLAMSWRDAIDGIRNVALYAGLGVVWVVTSRTGRLGQEVRRATLTGALLSLTVETAQLFSRTRVASLVDVASNVAGAFGGAVAVAVLIVAVRGAKGGRSYFGVPTFLIAGSYALAAASEALTPFFRGALQPDPGGGPVQRLLGGLRPARPLSLGRVSWDELLLFLPAGFFLVMMLAERGESRRRIWPWVAVGGVVGCFTLEWLHALARLEISWEAATIHAIGIGLGAWAAQRWLGPLTRGLRGGQRALALLTGYAGLLILWGWRPLLPETSGRLIAAQLTVERFIPLRSLAERVDVFSVTHVVQQAALYLPLGALLAVWPLRLRGAWSQLWPALWLTLLIEVGHIFIVGRYFDITNVLLALAGAIVGWIVVRRCGFAPYGEALAGARTAAPSGGSS
jgi:VanZ family protein